MKCRILIYNLYPGLKQYCRYQFLVNIWRTSEYKQNQASKALPESLVFHDRPYMLVRIPKIWKK